METKPSTSEVPIMEDSHNFFKVARTQAFVDKSLLIETAFKHGSRMLITAPSKFCKSTNLHMMKCFLSDSSDQAESKVFKTLDIYKRSKNLYKQHFHKNKVVFLDFTSGKSASYSDALDAYRWAIHNTFLEHDYLLRTSVLKSSEEKIFSSWCDINRGYKTKQKEDIVNDLSLLVEVLARQSGNKVIILVDEYDSLIIKGMYEGLSDNELNDIFFLTIDVLRSLLEDGTMVKLAMVCGTSIIVANEIMRLIKLDIAPFLYSHEFSQFYGLMEDELKTILKRYDFKKQPIQVSALSMWYGTYINQEGREVFNILSVLKHLKNRKRCPYWPIQYQAEQFINLSRSPKIARVIHQLLYEESVILEIPDAQKIKRLGLAYSRNVKNIEDITWLVYHFANIGLITAKSIDPDMFFNPSETSDFIEVYIHNNESDYIISHYFQRYLIENCNIPTNYYRTTYLEFNTNRQKSGVLQLAALFYDEKK